MRNNLKGRLLLLGPSLPTDPTAVSSRKGATLCDILVARGDARLTPLQMGPEICVCVADGTPRGRGSEEK